MSELIYKQDAIDLVKEVCDAIMSSCNSHYDPETGDEVYNDLLEVDAILKCNKEIRIALANLPSAEPERKKGKWIFIHPLQADDEGAYICSNCHRGDWDIKPADKYCKFCGMAMNIYATLLP